MNKKLLLLILTVLLSFSLWGCFSPKPKLTASVPQVQVIMLDIGQGDSILIKTQEKNILVDTGKIEQRAKLVEKLKKYQVNTIDLLIATHPHEDHIGGIQAVLENFTVKEIYDSGAKSSSKLYANYLKQAKNKKIKFSVPKEGQTLVIDDSLKLEFLTPLINSAPELRENMNNNSIVFRLVTPDLKMLFTGDIEKEVEKFLLEKQAEKLKSDILKVPHHGSRTSSSKKFLEVVNAKDAVVSAAKENEYKHPHPEVVSRYKARKQSMYLTADKGDICITSAGTGYNIKTER